MTVERGRICVFAKAPRPGDVKTRLASVLGDRGAADLARAFLLDTWSQLKSSADRARPVLALAGDPGAVELPAAEIWPQGGGDLGARIERILQRALQGADGIAGAPWTIAVGTDSPGLPSRLVDQAIDALADTSAVIGPCDDGGFYLLGLRRCPEGLLADLPWSEPTTFEATCARLTERGLAPAILDPWFDIDRPDDLDRLCALIARGEASAPATRAALARLGRPV